MADPSPLETLTETGLASSYRFSPSKISTQTSTLLSPSITLYEESSKPIRTTGLLGGGGGGGGVCVCVCVCVCKGHIQACWGGEGERGGGGGGWSVKVTYRLSYSMVDI